MYWIFLIIGAILTLVFVIGKIRSNRILTADAVFWFVLAVCFVLMAIFPQVVILLSNLLGFDSPANFVFLSILAIVIYRLLTTSVELAHLRSQVVQLTETLALSGLSGESDVSDLELQKPIGCASYGGIEPGHTAGGGECKSTAKAGD